MPEIRNICLINSNIFSILTVYSPIKRFVKKIHFIRFVVYDINSKNIKKSVKIKTFQFKAIPNVYIHIIYIANTI